MPCHQAFNRLIRIERNFPGNQKGEASGDRQRGKEQCEKLALTQNVKRGSDPLRLGGVGQRHEYEKQHEELRVAEVVLGQAGGEHGDDAAEGGCGEKASLGHL